MSGFKNVIEDIVVKISQDQLDFLRADLKLQINLSEVVAYALNRLPPLYVTTEYGWVHQHNRALDELSQDISTHVRRAIQALQVGDPLHDHTPLPEDELSSKARSLVMLSKLLDKENLRWRDLPSAVFDATHSKEQEEPIIYDETLVQENIKHLSGGRRSTVMGVKGYLTRSKKRRELSKIQKLSWAETVKASDKLSLDDQELGSYVLKAQLGYSNVLEKLVVLVAEHLMRSVPPQSVVKLICQRSSPLRSTGYHQCTLRAIAAINYLDSAPNPNSPKKLRPKFVRQFSR
jgi:hypothetical protein